MSEIARTVEDVRRLAPTAGFYWVRAVGRGFDFTRRWHVRQLVEWSDDLGGRQWSCPQPTNGTMADPGLVNAEIIGPLTPPSEEDTHG